MDLMMEPLPGLLDDPLLHFQYIPASSDLHIAPLRNPVPSKTTDLPSPLEPRTSREDDRRSHKVPLDAQKPSKKTENEHSMHPAENASSGTTRKPVTAISELVTRTRSPLEDEAPSAELPSFVSLAVVERSPSVSSLPLSEGRAPKRPRLDSDYGNLDDYIHLPRPQRNTHGIRAPPLLPSIVNGLHEPPPNAALLPPMSTSSQSQHLQISNPSQSTAVPERRRAPARPPEKMLNTPEMEPAHLLPDLLGQNDFDTFENDPGTGKQAVKPPDPDRQMSLAIGADKELKRAERITNTEADSAQNALTRKEPSNDLEQAKCKPAKSSKDATTRSASPATQVDPSASASQKPASTRRPRRTWTTEEDQRLLQGVARYGFQWTAIHDDAELDLAHRKATDLRDRIRNKFPDGYKNAESAPFKTDARRARPKKTSVSVEQAEVTDREKKAEKKMRPRSAKQGKATRTDEATGYNAEGAQQQEAPGTTLPPFAFDEDDDLDWGDNTLPPLLDLEELGILK